MEIFLEFLKGGILGTTWWQLIIYTLVATHITIACVTIFLHRSQAHRGLDLHPAVAHFFRLWLWLTTGMVTKEWVAIHRKHHAKCEKEGDPHSPVVYGIQKVFFEGAELYRAEAKNQETLDRYGHGTPNDWIERHVYSRFTWQGVAITLILNFILFGVLGIAIWAVQMMWIPFWAAGVVNGIGHFWGYRNYASPDTSTNIFPIGIIIGGEELHNNHHAHGTSAKFSAKWYEFDLGWMYIRTLAFLRLATIKKVAPKLQLDTTKMLADQDTLEAVITHRYEIMARYAEVLKESCYEEIQRLKRQSSEVVKGLRFAKNRIHRVDDESLSEKQRERLNEVLEQNALLAGLVDMGRELSHVWERSTASSEQLVSQLQAWVDKAKASENPKLAVFAKRIQAYVK